MPPPEGDDAEAEADEADPQDASDVLYLLTVSCTPAEATFYLYDLDTDLVYAPTAEDDHVYRLAEGWYGYEASCEGYVTVQGQVHVSEDSLGVLELTLNKDDGSQTPDTHPEIGGQLGESLTWKVEYQEGEYSRLIISGTGPIPDFDRDNPNLPWGPYGITEVVIEEGVTAIGSSAFAYCNDLASVTLPGTVTAIGDYAFNCCFGLTSFTVPDTVTTLGGKAFYDCENLETLNFPEHITMSGDGAFGVTGLRKLTELSIPEGVEALSMGAFAACYSLKKVTLPLSLKTVPMFVMGDTDAYDVEWSYRGTDAQWAKVDCLEGSIRPLTTDHVHEYETVDGVEPTCTTGGHIAYTRCYKCGRYWTVDGEQITLNQTRLGSLGHDTEAVPETDGSAAHYICKRCGELFWDAEATEPVWEGDLANGKPVQCGTAGEQVGYSLYEDGTLRIYGSGAMNGFYEGEAPWANSTVKHVILEEGITTVGDGAFAGCTALESVPTFPSTLRSIGSEAFKGCTNMVGSVVLPEAAEYIGEDAFNGDEGLTGLTLNEGLGYIGWRAFYGCKNLWSGQEAILTLPESLGNMYGDSFAGTGLQGYRLSDQGSWNFRVEDGVLYSRDLQRLVAVPDGKNGPGTVLKLSGLTTEISGYANCAPETLYIAGKFPSGTVLDGLEEGIRDLYYAGTEEEWNQLLIPETQQEKLRNTQLHFSYVPTEYAIRYDFGDTMTWGTLENPNPDTAPVNAVLKLEPASCEAHTFLGWYKDANYTQKVTQIPAGNTETLTLYGRFKPHTYTITFNGNGHKGGSMASMRFDSETEITIPECAYKRPGYTFVAWASDPEGEFPEYYIHPGDTSYWVLDEDGFVITLYAVWEPVGMEVAFDANGGTGDMDNLSTAYDETVTLPQCGFEKTGYIFTGWNTRADGRGKTYAAGAKVKNLASEGTVTLYAMWKAGTYTVEFNAAGGTGRMNKQTLTYDKAAKLTANGFRRTGYLFDGWADSQGNTYADKQEVLNLVSEGTLELTAQWKPITYQVVFKANGAQGDIGGLTLTYDAPQEQPEFGFTRENYRFVGWATSANGKVVCEKDAPLSNLTDKNGSTVTLYAKWVPFSYTVVYDGNGAEKGTMKDQTMLCGKTYTLSGNAYSRSGYTFQGWTLTADGKTADYTNSQRGVALSDTDEDVVTLYALWQPITYKITYKNLTNDELTLVPQSYTIEEPAALEAMSRDGFDFGGWFLDSGFRKPVEEITGTGAKTVYAKWTVHKYTVAFDGNGANKGTMKPLAMVCGTAKNLTGNGYSRVGYTFQGWATTPNADVPEYKNSAKVQDLTFEDGATVTLYAVWQPITYKITYKNLTNDELNTLPVTYTIENTVVLDTMSRDGFDFGGWFLDSGFKKPVEEISGTGAKTVYAKWTAHKYAVVFDGNGADKGTMKDLVMTCGTAKNLTGNGYSRVGYTFQGWATTPNADVPEYKNSAKVQDLTFEDGATVTLYAVWQPITYKITYKNLTAAETEMMDQTYTVENTIHLSELMRDGYDFGGWFLDSGFKKPVEEISGIGAKTVYAKWTAHKYTVAFDGNGADKGTMKPLAMTCGTARNLTGNGYSRVGYTFQGWATTPDADTVVYKNGAKVQDLTFEDGGVVTLYAVWKAK